MRRFPPAIITQKSGRNATALDAASDHEPPSPADLFARLSLLLVVALCFGLAAQLLVELSH